MNVCFHSHSVIVGPDVDSRRADTETAKTWAASKIWYAVSNLVYSFNDRVALELVTCEADSVFLDP